MVRKWEWEGGERGWVGDSRKLRRLYIFSGDFCVSQFVCFFNVEFFYRGWNVSIGMNALCPHFYMKRVGEKKKRKKKGNRTYAS